MGSLVRKIHITCLRKLLFITLTFFSHSVVNAQTYSYLDKISSSGEDLGGFFITSLTKISPSGRYVVYLGRKDGVDLNPYTRMFVYDRYNGQKSSITSTSLTGVGFPSGLSAFGDFSLSDNGPLMIAFEADAKASNGNTYTQIFLLNYKTKALERITKLNNGTPDNINSSGPILSKSGRYILYGYDLALMGSGSKLILHDRQTGTKQNVALTYTNSLVNGPIKNWGMSTDARYIVFTARATNLVEPTVNMPFNPSGASDHVYVRDRNTGDITIETLAPNATEFNHGTGSGDSITDDGRYVAFTTSSNLFGTNVPAGETGVFLKDRNLDTFKLISRNANGSILPENAGQATVSATGKVVLYYGQEFSRPNFYLHYVGTNIYKKFSPDDNTLDTNIGSAHNYSISYDASVINFSQGFDGQSYVKHDDRCPSNPDKILPGICGCNIADLDSDSDGTKDCNDACPSDPNKSESPGVCGCGIEDISRNGKVVCDNNDGKDLSAPELSLLTGRRLQMSMESVPFVKHYSIKLKCKEKVNTLKSESPALTRKVSKCKKLKVSYQAIMQDGSKSRSPVATIKID